MNISTGRLILSEPFMEDPNFKRSVVLLCEHKEEGSLGFIINKTLNMSLPEAVPELEGFDAPLYFGGPVETDTLHYLHCIPDLDGSIEIMDGLYWGGNFEILSIMIQSGQVALGDIRFYLGYAGWSPGQLRDEMAEHSWYMHDASRSYVFSAPRKELWKKIMKEMGGQFRLMSTYPEDPRLN